MLTRQQIDQYLNRISFNRNLTTKSSINCIQEIKEQDSRLETLNELHKAHMKSVPFENLDINLGKVIRLSKNLLFDKIVLQNRGGFCYELNYLFSILLNSCGIKSSLLSAQVFDGVKPGKEFEHLLVLVELEGDAGCERLIADVGFGDSFIKPLRLDGKPVKQLGTSYKVVYKENKYILFQKKVAQEWHAQYVFSLTNHHINAFEEMCNFQQSSPQSNFTQKSVCTIATEIGRKTIANGKFIETIYGNKEEFSILDSKHYREMLRQHFELLLPDKIAEESWKNLSVNLNN